MLLPETTQALRSLGTGPVGIGENHTTTKGRDVVLELLKLTPRPVRKLFIELPPRDTTAIARAVQVFQNGGAQSDVEKSLAAQIMEQHGCDIKLKEVIATAICNNVSVYCADDRIAASGNRGGNAVRNKTIFKVFQDNTNAGGTTGCLLLFGGAHFDANDDPPTLIKLFTDGHIILRYLKCG